MMRTRSVVGWIAAIMVLIAMSAASASARDWNHVDFAKSPLFAYPLPRGHDNIIGSLTTYTITPGDTLLDIGRWYTLTASEISEANDHINWWTPPVGRKIVLPTEHILPAAPHVGIVMNIPEMRLYYYYPTPIYRRLKSGKLVPVASGQPQVVYTFPVGLGRFDWRTPIRDFRVIGKVKDPVWVVPQDIYEEHLIRDGPSAKRVYPAGPDNPLGLFKLTLNLPEYAIHGTSDAWGVGMTVSHGCVRLYPEDIERLFYKVKVGTPGRFVYQPVKFGWRGDALYVEVHPDIYNKYPGLWQHAVKLAKADGLLYDIDMHKLEKAVAEKNGIPTYVMPGPPPGAGIGGEEARNTGWENVSGVR